MPHALAAGRRLGAVSTPCSCSGAAVCQAAGLAPASSPVESTGLIRAGLRQSHLDPTPVPSHHFLHCIRVIRSLSEEPGATRLCSTLWLPEGQRSLVPAASCLRQASPGGVHRRMAGAAEGKLMPETAQLSTRSEFSTSLPGRSPSGAQGQPAQIAAGSLAVPYCQPAHP